MTERELLKELHTGLIRWYPFREDARILFFVPAADNDPMREEREDMADYLAGRGYQISRVTPETYRAEGTERYDYICMLGIVELLNNPAELLKAAKNALKGDGKLILGTDNRFSIRYFCGDHDAFTDRSFDGIENYETLFQQDKDQIGARCYARYELDHFLSEAGILQSRYYSVFPDIRFPQLIYAEDYEPNEELVIRYFPMYHHPSSIFLYEEKLLNPLAENKMLHRMANGYFIECGKKEELSDICHVTLALDRGEDSMMTIIRKNPYPKTPDLPEGSYDPEYSVEKIPAGKNGQKKLDALLKHSAELHARGIHTVPAALTNGRYIMPYITAIGGVRYFTLLAEKGREEFLKGLDHFRDLLLKTSEAADYEPDISFGVDETSGKPIRCKDTGIVLKKGYLDFMPLNAFVIEGEFYFYDQEFAAENYPAKAILMRAFGHVYSPGKVITNALPFEEMLERYELKTDQVQWWKLAALFTEKLRHEKELYDYTARHIHDNVAISTNRERISFSVTEYQRLFVELFRDLEGKELILFGTGAFTRQFLSMFRRDVPVTMLLDNNPEKQGKEMEGIPIFHPSVLREKDPDSYKLIVCIKQYVGVLKQLQEYPVKYMGIFDPYTRFEMPESRRKEEQKRRDFAKAEHQKAEGDKKPYHIGYISGVFDLFHIGHLNLFRRAKEYCDYLIVGVSTDEWIRRFKGTDPVVPFEERRAIVEACRYVDEAVEIPTYADDALNAWRRYHFDVQFSGSDYEHDKGWLDTKAKLEENGATVMFFPYTVGTSTTKRKDIIKKNSNSSERR